MDPPIIPRKTRGINKIQDLPAGEVVEFNRLGQAVGKWQNLYGKYIGTRTRRLISMNIEDWKHVTKEQKDFLWLDIKTHFRLENNDVKVPTLLSCGTKWKAWKTELRGEYMLNNKSPMDKWTYVEPHVWEEFCRKENTPAKIKLRAEASERGKQYEIDRTRLGPKGYRGFEEKWEKERNDPDKATDLHKVPDIRGSNYCLARAPRDKDGNTTLPPNLVDLSKDLTKASQQLSEGTIESKAGVDPLILVMGPEHGGRTRGVGTNVGYKKGIKGYIRKKRTYQHQEDIENLVTQKVKEVIQSPEFWEEMRGEIRREIRSESNKGLLARQDEVEFPRQSVASTNNVIKLNCIKEETYCCLYVPSSVSTQEKVTCATATVFPIGDGLIHGKKLLHGHMKVSVIKVVDFYKTMELPVPDEEFPTLLNAVKGFIQWPISAIARFKGLTKTPVSRAATKSVLPQHQKVPATEKRKGLEIAQEPTNKKKAFEEITNHKMAATKISEQLQAKERDVKRKAEHRKELNDLKPAITLHRPKSVLNGYNRWMSRGNDCVEPYNIHVGKEVFRQVEDSYFAINPTDIIELLTNKKLELGILTCFEMSLYQLKGRSQQNKVGFLHPELITPDVYGANRGATLDYLARALEGYEFYVAPYLQGAHYVLFIICPKHGRGFILDSLKTSVFHSEDEYMLAGLVDSVLGDSLKWELPIVNRQPGEWECGYYVMKWMQDFVLKYQNDNFPNTIPWDEDRRLENTELDAVIGAWFTLWRG